MVLLRIGSLAQVLFFGIIGFSLLQQPLCAESSAAKTAVKTVVKAEKKEDLSTLLISGAKALKADISSEGLDVLTVNFKKEMGTSVVHLILCGDIEGGDITYDAWISLGTKNSMVQNAQRNVSAGIKPIVNVSFVEGSGISKLKISTGPGQKISNPYIVYQICGKNIKSAA